MSTQFSFPHALRSKAIIAGAVVLLLLVAVLIGKNVLKEDYDILFHQRVSAESDLRIMFPKEMDEKSVEEHLIIPSDLNAEKKWDGGVLVLDPVAPLEPDRTYIVSLTRGAMTTSGEPLPLDYDFRFTVAGPPAVSAHMPAVDSPNIDTSSAITVIFDRPMVPLQMVHGSQKGTASSLPIRITPDVKGRWRWLGTTTVQFTPSTALTASTKYTVTVPKEIKTAQGEPLAADYSWSFETKRPQVLSISPVENSDTAGPTTPITITFNQEMDPARAKGAIHVLVSPAAGKTNGKQIAVSSFSFGTTEDENGKKVPDKKILVAKLAEKLPLDSRIDVKIPAGLKAEEGDLGSPVDYATFFRTVPPFAVKNAVYEYGQVKFEFTSPLPEQNQWNNFSISPAVPDFKPDPESPMADAWMDYKQMSIWMNLKPSTKYTITLDAKMKDAYGQTLGKPYTYAFTTPPLNPEVFIYSHANRTFSIFEKDKPPFFYVNGVNVSRFDTMFRPLSIEEFITMRSNTALDFDYSSLETLGEQEKIIKKTITLPKKQDLWQRKDIDIEKEYGKLLPGIYAFTAEAPEYKYSQDSSIPYRQLQYFALTNIALTLKYSGQRALVWAVDMQTGNPVAGANISIIGANGTRGPTGTTDKAGFFEAALDLKSFNRMSQDWRPEFWVIAEKGDDFAFLGSDWNGGVQPWDFDFISEDFRSPAEGDYRIFSHITTDRPLYRAGDTMHYKGVVRLLDRGGKFVVPNSKYTANVTITDQEGKQVDSKSVKLNDFGTYNSSFTIDQQGSLGLYSINVTLSPDEGLGYQYMGQTFSVLAYRKPEYAVSVVTETENIFSGDTAEFHISGSYYFGAPMSDATVVWRAYSMDYFFNKFTDGWYSFALSDSWCWFDCQGGEEMVSDGKGKLDAAGKLTVKVPANISEKSLSQIYSLEADITDANNQVVSARGSVMVHKADAYVGIRPDDYVVVPGQGAKIGLITLKPDGSMLPNTSVKLDVFKRTWNSIRKKGVDGEYYYESEAKDEFLRTASVKTDDKGKLSTTVQVDGGGEFRVVATVKDSKGRETKSSTSVYAWSDTVVGWARTNNDRIEVVSDKPEYKAGETAKLLVKTPFFGKGVKALVTVERENVITKKVVDVTSNAMPIEIPITEDLVPVAYASVVVIKPRMGETFDEDGIDTGAPAFKMGMVKLAVNVAPKRVDLSVKTDKETYGPGETVTLTVNAKDQSGKPVQTDVSLAAVDMSLLALSGFEKPDLMDIFYGYRGLGTQTTNTLLMLMDRFKPGSKGGGGGADPETRARGDFKDTAYWNPSVVTNANGTATVSFKLPDNLTTWHILAIGNTKQSTFGVATHTFIETKKVILRPVRPRFAITGDKAILKAIVHNFLPEQKTFTVTLDGSGFEKQNEGALTLTLKPDQQGSVEFPVVFLDATQAKFHFKAETDGAVDEITETIPVQEFSYRQSVATSGVTDSMVTEQVIVPSKNEASNGSLDISISPSLASYLPGGLEYVSTFPYGCAEQISSSLRPNIALSMLQKYAAFQFVPKAELAEKVNTGLQKIYTYQRPDGGFGYFAASQRSYAPLTAYVVDTLTLARRADFNVDSSVLDNAKGFLRSALQDKTPETMLSDNERAYVLFVLAEDGSIDTASLNALYEKRQTLTVAAQAQLAMALKKANTSQTNSRASALVTQLLNLAKVDARGTHFEEQDNSSYTLMNTNAKSTALVLQALTRVDSKHPVIPKIVRYMLEIRRDGHWDTTQSTVATILAFIEYIQKTEELAPNFTAGVGIGTKEALKEEFTSANAATRKQVVLALKELPRGQVVDVNIGKSGKGNLYYDLVMTYDATGDIEPAEEGMSILREVTPLDPSIKGQKVGGTYKVTLTITVPQDRHFVAVESYIPAGMELINTQFATSQQQLLQDQINQIPNGQYWVENPVTNALWRFGHIEQRDDQLFMFADELPTGVYKYEYVMRATVPGTFHLKPAHVYEMYMPETFGQTDGGWYTIEK